MPYFPNTCKTQLEGTTRGFDRPGELYYIKHEGKIVFIGYLYQCELCEFKIIGTIEKLEL